MKDLFPDKKFIFKEIDGIRYISEDTHNELMKEGRQSKLKDELEFLDKIISALIDDNYLLIHNLCFERKQQTLKDVLEILKRFKDDDIYSGRIVKFEIKNRLGGKE